MCHGKHIRQYHEEKETGQVSVQSGNHFQKLSISTISSESNCVFSQKISVQEYFLGSMAQKSQTTETGMLA